MLEFKHSTPLDAGLPVRPYPYIDERLKEGSIAVNSKIEVFGAGVVIEVPLSGQIMAALDKEIGTEEAMLEGPWISGKRDAIRQFAPHDVKVSVDEEERRYGISQRKLEEIESDKYKDTEDFRFPLDERRDDGEVDRSDRFVMNIGQAVNLLVVIK